MLTWALWSLMTKLHKSYNTKTSLWNEFRLWLFVPLIIGIQADACLIILAIVGWPK